MSLDMKRARKLCDAADWRLVEASSPEALKTLTLAKLRNRLDRARKLRDTWCDLATSYREQADKHGSPDPAVQGRAAFASQMLQQFSFEEKAELFSEVFRRFEERLKEVESSISEASGGGGPGRKRAARSKTTAAKPTRPPSTDEFIAQLRKLRFCEGYTDSAAKLAEERIRKQHAEGLSGPLREHFERFPGFALVFISIYGEWDYDPYEPLVETVAQNSFGMFNPTDITDERDEEGETATLSFTVDGRRYSRTITVEDSGGWVPWSFWSSLRKRSPSTAETSISMRRFSVLRPRRRFFDLDDLHQQGLQGAGESQAAPRRGG